MNIKLVEVLNNYELLLLFKEKSYCQGGGKIWGMISCKLMVYLN